MRIILIALINFLVIGVNAAIPPLSQQDRNNFASDIIDGFVLDIEQTIDTHSKNFSNYIYKVKIFVTDTYKRTGQDHKNSVIYFTYWQPKERPSGFVGPQGQNNSIKKDDYIKAYLSKDKSGNLSLLTPNGFDLLGPMNNKN